MHGPRGVDALGADDLLGPADQHRVVEHQDLRVEQRRQLAAGPLREARADVLQLLPRLVARALQRLHFPVDAIRRDREAHHFGALREDHGAADDDAGRDADAGQAFHNSSPKPPSTRRHSASTASASSAPSAVMTTVRAGARPPAAGCP